MALLLAPATALGAFAGQNGKIAFVGSELGCSGACELNLYTVNPDGTGRTRILDAPGGESGPRWSSDGASLVYAADRPGTPRDIYKINGDGSGGEVRLTTNPAIDLTPAWSPDGARIVFSSNRSGAFHLWSMNNDGSNQTQITSGPGTDYEPVFSPDGTKIAFTSTRDDPSPPCIGNCETAIYVMDADGSDITRVPISDAPDCWLGVRRTHPDWSPSGDRLAFSWSAGVDCAQELDTTPSRIETIRPDGAGQTILREELYGGWDTEPAWSPDGARIVHSQPPTLGMRTINSSDGSAPAPVTEGDSPSWQPVPVNSDTRYVRPIGATPFRASLVPAAKQCTSPNRQHGPPLAFGSCSPVVSESPNVTVSQGDARLRSIGFVRLDTHIGQPGPPDDSDVNLSFSLTNVMKSSDFTDYGGELQGSVLVRRTDREPPFIQSTTQDFRFEFTVPCTTTPGSALDGSACQAVTTINAIVPGAIKDSARTMWAFDRFQVFDGGADGDADTDADNKLFATQGVFVP
jgi:Tol biopolymer transport system component